jgi:F-box/WD-40 domain protein 7
MVHWFKLIYLFLLKLQEGVILVWKDGPEANPFQLAAPLEGHTGAVVCLKVEANRLYSGSVDHTIRVSM